jgi:hypothetical protein
MILSCRLITAAATGLRRCDCSEPHPRSFHRRRTIITQLAFVDYCFGGHSPETLRIAVPRIPARSSVGVPASGRAFSRSTFSNVPSIWTRWPACCLSWSSGMPTTSNIDRRLPDVPIGAPDFASTAPGWKVSLDRLGVGQDVILCKCVPNVKLCSKSPVLHVRLFRTGKCVLRENPDSSVSWEAVSILHRRDSERT